MAFSFGTPAATPAFGAASAPAFGATGAALAFGSPAPAAGSAFAAAPTSLFGATPATPSLFGAASSAAPATPSLFGTGAAATAPSLFGAPATAPAPVPSLFSASSMPTPLFGASSAAASAPSLFGAAPASTPFLFGAAPASTPSLFGAAPASTPSLFGAAPASTPSLFGAAPASAPSLFGPAAPAPLFGAAPAGASGAGSLQDHAAVLELESLAAAISAGAGSVPGPPPAGQQAARFQAFFFSVTPDPAARVKPPGVDDLVWRAALRRLEAFAADLQAGSGTLLPATAAQLWPAPAAGFRGLLARKALQDAALVEHRQRLEALAQTLGHAARRQAALLGARLEEARGEHARLRGELLAALRRTDLLEGRLARAVGLRGAGTGALLRRLDGELRSVEAALHGDGRGPGLIQAVHAAVAAVRGGAGPCVTPAELAPWMDPAALSKILLALDEYTQALGKIQDVLEKDAREVALLESEARGEL